MKLHKHGVTFTVTLKQEAKQHFLRNSVAHLRESKTNHRFLYLVGEFDRGGLERQLFYLLRAMDRELYKPAVAVWNYREEDLYVPQVRELGVPIYGLTGVCSPMGKLLAFRHLAQNLQPEVIHSYNFYTNFAAYCAAKGSDAVPVGSIRSDFNWAKTESGPILGRLSALWPSDQICNSFSALRSARSSRCLFAPARISVVRNGVDLDEFQSLPLSSHRPIRIVGIGYLLPVKRWDRLLLAVRELKHRGLEFKLQIAGDGPLGPTLRRQTQDLGLIADVEFIGHVDNIPKLLAHASFVVHAADSEGCPNAVMEAMACGRAVVATDAGDIPRLIENGKTGYVIHRNDSAALIDRMTKLMTDHDLCRAMGKAARILAEREFGLKRLVKETLASYNDAGWKGTSSI
jgi:glycosyltransferase involved in cell wall biosynthesis